MKSVTVEFLGNFVTDLLEKDLVEGKDYIVEISTKDTYTVKYNRSDNRKLIIKSVDNNTVELVDYFTDTSTTPTSLLFDTNKETENLLKMLTKMCKCQKEEIYNCYNRIW